MSLIDRYIQEVGRHLPRKNRGDIQEELRSLLVDALEDQEGSEPTEEQVAAFLTSYGEPKTVAAPYFPEGQYLVGPALFPLFKMVLGIAIAAVIGGQIIAWTVSATFGEAPFPWLEAIGGVWNSVPITLGWVTLVFALLQWFEVRPDQEAEKWDPLKLPQVFDVEPVKRGELIFEIVFSVIILVLFLAYTGDLGFVPYPGGRIFENPVIVKYIWWITASLMIGIVMDIYLLWQGRWSAVSRVLKIGANLLSIGVLVLLLQGHNTWLAEHGSPGFFLVLEQLPQNLEGSTQLIGMHVFRMGIGIALVVTVVEIAVMLVRMGLDKTRKADRVVPAKV